MLFPFPGDAQEWVVTRTLAAAIAPAAVPVGDRSRIGRIRRRRSVSAAACRAIVTGIGRAIIAIAAIRARAKCQAAEQSSS